MNRTESAEHPFFHFFLTNLFSSHRISFIIHLCRNNRYHGNAAIQFFYFVESTFFIICFGFSSYSQRCFVSSHKSKQQTFWYKWEKIARNTFLTLFFRSRLRPLLTHEMYVGISLSCVGRFMWAPMRYDFVGEIVTCIIWFIAIYFAQIALKSYGRRHPSKCIPK